MVDQVLHAIAEPHRRAILVMLQDQELPAQDIAGQFPDVTRQAISQHLALLAETGLVTMRRQGTRRLYRTRPEGLADVRRFLDGFWDEQLAALKRQVESDTRGERPA
jgi:DNA-binding transcriptional ArsR family regulator